MSSQEELMKKLLLLLIALIFLVVSCSGSKKAENDADLMPDEDAVDVDETDEDDEDAIADDDEIEDIDLCEPDPCENFANVDGTCLNKEDGSFECGCLEGYFWANPGCKKITFANICTGQKTCYNRDVNMKCSKEGEDFYGQDAHYAKKGFCIPKNLSSTTASYSEGLTLDNNLKIEWLRKTADSTYSWDEAVKYCEELEYAGHDDWRLPSPKELMFAGTLLNPVKYLWSSQGSNDTSAWKIQTSSKYLSTAKKSETNDVRCVRGERPEIPRLYEIQDRNMVFDPVNGLSWDTSYTGRKSWMEALAYCENSTHAGFSDWRVPNINELLSLVNYVKDDPDSDFPYSAHNFGYDMWWSSTTLDAGSEYASYARTAVIYTGETSSTVKYDEARVICVRNEPCRQGYFLHDKKCVESPCNDDPCINIEHSDGICHLDYSGSHFCGCVENYFWDGNKCVNPCDSEPCKNAKHSDQKCKPVDAFRYSCGCTGNYHWWNEDAGCIEKQPFSGNICTGQTKCYSNEETMECPSEGEDFFGQDANYAELEVCIPQNFLIDDTVKSEPTVVDLNTKLEWQQTFSEAITGCYYPCDEAVDYCENLNYGGHDDWRLPTILELHTIVDSEKVNPATNTNYFPNTPSEYFMSESSSLSLYASGGPHDPSQEGTRSYWFVDFSTGISTISPTKDSHIRCVRGEKLPKKTSYILAGNNKRGAEIAFYSNGTLIWQAETRSYGWQNALKYCENLNLAGLVNWRLPNKNELLEYFTPCGIYSVSYYMGYWYDYYPSKYHWSSTTVYNKPEKAWIVNYGDCLGYAHYDSFQDKTDSYLIHTRCVTDNPCFKGEIWNGESCVKENPCEPNPCKEMYYITGNCIISSKETNGYFCECSENSFWSSDEKRCIRTCGGRNPCIYDASHTDQQCYEDEKGEFYCGCVEPYYWNSEKHTCSKKCETDPCADKENSDGHCSDDTEHGYVCGCIEGYTWNFSDGECQ